MRRIVFEAAVFGRIVRRSDNDAVGQSHFSVPIEIENGAGNRGSGRVLAIGSNADVNFVGRQHLERGGEGGLGKRMRIDAQEERPIDSLLLAIRANSLCHRENMPLIESAMERRAAMARGSKGDALLGNFRIGTVREIRGDQPGNVDEIGWLAPVDQRPG